MNFNDGNLRPLEREDLDLVLEWRNSERIRYSMFSDSIISKADHYNWFESMPNESSIHLLFEFGNYPVGISNFKEIDDYNSKCMWGFYLGESDLPRGCGLVLGIHSLDYAFDKMNIRKLCSQVLATNIVSLKFHLKLGFSEEGLLRRHIKKDDKYVDVISLAQFCDEWQLKRQEIIAVLEHNY